MNLYFQNSQGKLKLIAEPETDKEVYAAIKQFLDNHNFKSYYTRTWIDERNIKWFDIGSHTELFLCSEEKLLDEDEFVSGEYKYAAQYNYQNNHQQSIKN